jgi:glycosyltransferase involved in cell wall biosynthesis
MKKTKILTISDHPLSPSGVGTQTKYFIEALLKTGRYEVVSFGGAIKHKDYRPIRIDPWGDNWTIFPVDGYGNPEMIRSVLQKEKPDLLWFMTDPRFYGWLWEMENEIRALVPMVYYHVWDNFPAPHFNGGFYRSTDEIACISKVTYDILQEVSPEVSSCYLPHAVNSELFKAPKTAEEKKNIQDLRKRILSASGVENDKRKIFFWNNRNARRKQSGTLIWWFKEWLDKVGHDKAMLLMHTDARDPHGQDLPHIINKLGLNKGQVLLSTNKIEQKELSNLYSAADYTINISDAEGFGLATLESLSCGTPIIVNMTGGLQEQVTDGKNWFGFGIEPASKTVIGSLQVPYIYEDRITQKDFENALNNALTIRPKAYKKMVTLGKAHVRDNYGFTKFEDTWVKLIDGVVEKHGSWENRKNHKRWFIKEVA